jgi:uncharacterized repeat protein (TIGR01451 family)
MTRFFRMTIAALGLVVSAHASATFHLWQITEIFSNASGTIQYIELEALAGGQQFVNGHSLYAERTGNGGGSVGLTYNLPGDTAGKKMLIASDAFAALGVVTPDYVFSSSFHSVGFLGVAGGSIDFAHVDVWSHGALPTSNLALYRNGTTGTPTPTNFAGQTGNMTGACLSGACANLSATIVSAPAQALVGRDVAYRVKVLNPGPHGATNVVMTHTLPTNSAFVWAPSFCTHVSGTVTCNIGAKPVGGEMFVQLAVRPVAAGTLDYNVSVSATETDPNSADNQHASAITASVPPAANHVQRYRLYSPVTLEHHFTTDLNEYNVLGALTGTWVQEGGAGKVLDNPGSFNGVEAVQYYRLYHSPTQWHHWTTDANEYYTLGMFPGWNQEGVDGFILPTATAGAIQLYRLNYPFTAGLHHWTIDPVEYNQLITNFGWIGEGGSGFVVE